MKKIEINQMEFLEGGGKCEMSAGAILLFGIGTAFAAVPTPMTWALAGVSFAAGAIATYACPW